VLDEDSSGHDGGQPGAQNSRTEVDGERPAVTVHAYSPPLWRMGAYEIEPGGALRRHSISYAEELRPLSA